LKRKTKETQEEPKSNWSIDGRIPKDPVFDSRTVNYYKYRAFDKKN
jgi:hypothetical protein